jgi:hypothetical protein
VIGGTSTHIAASSLPPELGLVVGLCTLESISPMTHNLYPFKPITYNISSEKAGFKVCLSNANLQRYLVAAALKALFELAVLIGVGRCTLESS